MNVQPWSSKVGFASFFFFFFCTEVFIIFVIVLWFLLPWRIFFQSAVYLSTPRLTGWPMGSESEKWVAKTWGGRQKGGSVAVVDLCRVQTVEGPVTAASGWRRLSLRLHMCVGGGGSTLPPLLPGVIGSFWCQSSSWIPLLCYQLPVCQPDYKNTGDWIRNSDNEGRQAVKTVDEFSKHEVYLNRYCGKRDIV